MYVLKKQLKRILAFSFLSTQLFAIPCMSATDLEAQESFAKARAKKDLMVNDQALHQNHLDKSQEFHGVFYGYVPCDDCSGIKMTLSLQQRNNYLLVTQPAKESSREYYERGKYTWNDEDGTVVLKPKKGGTQIRRYKIKDQGTLIQLNENGIEMDRYVLQSSDTVKSREVHIH